MANDLNGRVALITGAGRGIGRSLAVRLSAEGMKVALVARTQADVESARDEIVAAGGLAIAFAADGICCNRASSALVLRDATKDLYATTKTACTSDLGVHAGAGASRRRPVANL